MHILGQEKCCSWRRRSLHAIKSYQVFLLQVVRQKRKWLLRIQDSLQDATAEKIHYTFLLQVVCEKRKPKIMAFFRYTAHTRSGKI